MTYEFILIYLSIGLVSGVLTSIAGFGGGFIIVPALFWIINLTTDILPGESIKIAVATSLLIMLINMTISILNHRSNISDIYKTGKSYLAPIFTGSLFVFIFISYVQGESIKWIFVFYMIATLAINMRKSFFKLKNTPPPLISGKRIWLFGSSVGFSASLIGVGGSVFTVPHFRKRGMKMFSIIPVANMLALPIAFVGLLSYTTSGYIKNFSTDELYLSYGYLHLAAVLLIIPTSFIGIKLGTFISKGINDELHAKIYISLLAIAVIVMSIDI